MSRTQDDILDEVAMRIFQAKCTAWDAELSEDYRIRIVKNVVKQFGEGLTVEEGMAKSAYSAAESFVKIRRTIIE